MLKLHQFAPVLGLPNAHSFSLKLETYLRMTDIPFQSMYSMDIGKASQCQIPYIEDGGQRIVDSNVIIDYLKQTYGDRLDAHLTPRERSIALAMRRLLEDSLYWSMVHSRWHSPNSSQRSATLYSHGLNKRSSADIYAIGQADLVALSEFLADKLFLMGDQPTSLDASAYGVLANILWTSEMSPLQDQLLQLSNLHQYCEHLRDRYYPETHR